MAGFEDDVIAVLRRLEPGDVVTYGEVAVEAGHPGAARAVGNILARGDGLPWWRVVTSTGRLVPGNEHEHAQRLRAEGVAVDNGRVPGLRLRTFRTAGGSGSGRRAPASPG